MTEQWQELKETIIEMRDNDGIGTQQEVCKFLANLMDVLEKQMQEPCDGDDAVSRQAEIVRCKDCRKHNVSVGYKKDCCPLYEFRGISYGHEHDYQFCCFAERRTDE